MGYHRIFLSDRLEDLMKAGNLQAEDLVPKLLDDYFRVERESVSLSEVSAAEKAKMAAKSASREERMIRAEVRETELSEKRAKGVVAETGLIAKSMEHVTKTGEGKQKKGQGQGAEEGKPS